MWLWGHIYSFTCQILLWQKVEDRDIGLYISGTLWVWCMSVSSPLAASFKENWRDSSAWTPSSLVKDTTLHVSNHYVQITMQRFVQEFTGMNCISLHIIQAALLFPFKLSWSSTPATNPLVWSQYRNWGITAMAQDGQLLHPYYLSLFYLEFPEIKPGPFVCNAKCLIHHWAGLQSSCTGTTAQRCYWKTTSTTLNNHIDYSIFASSSSKGNCKIIYHKSLGMDVQLSTI